MNYECKLVARMTVEIKDEGVTEEAILTRRLELPFAPFYGIAIDLGEDGRDDYWPMYTSMPESIYWCPKARRFDLEEDCAAGYECNSRAEAEKEFRDHGWSFEWPPKGG